MKNHVEMKGCCIKMKGFRGLACYLPNHGNRVKYSRDGPFGRSAFGAARLEHHLAYTGQTNIHTMITQYEVPGYLARLVPTALLQPKLGAINMTIYKDLQHFTDYTRQAVDEHNYALAKRCFRLAEKLYDDGDAIVKNAVENIFVFSFSSIIPQDGVERIILKSYIPVTLYALYVKQINQGGC